MNIFKPKTKQEKQVQLVLLIILLAIIVWVVWKKVIQPRMNASQPVPSAMVSEPTSNSSSSGTGITTSNGLPKVGSYTTLKEGTTAQEVQWVQYYYNTKLARPKNLIVLEEDGKFGPKTKQIVQTIMNSPSTTWDAFKKKVDQVVSQGGVDYGNVFGTILWPF